MPTGYARTSLLLLGLSVLFLIALTATESVLVGMSQAAQRLVTFLLLVLPAGAGAIFGVASLQRREPSRVWSIAGILLNSLFALFHLLIIFFAG